MTTLLQKGSSADLMEHMAVHDAHGYTQGYGRWGNDGICEVPTMIGNVAIRSGDRDCSAGTISAYEAVGIDCGGATWTGDALECMTSTGNFVAHVMSNGWSCDDGYIAQRGDCYLAHHDGFKHMAMCLSSDPDMLAEFYVSETGGIYGQEGDQTGWECRIAGYYGGFDYVLECKVEGDDMSSFDVWNNRDFQEPYPTGAPMGTRVVYMDKFINEIRNQLFRTDTAGHDNPDGHDFFGRIQIIEHDVAEIKKALENPMVPIDSIVDLDALADKIVERLK